MKRALFLGIIAVLLWYVGTNVRQRLTADRRQRSEDDETTQTERPSWRFGKRASAGDYLKALQNVADGIYTPLDSGVSCPMETIQEISAQAQSEALEDLLDRQTAAYIVRLCGLLETMSIERERRKTAAAADSIKRHRPLGGPWPWPSGYRRNVRRYIDGVSTRRHVVRRRGTHHTRGKTQSDRDRELLFEDAQAQNWIDYLNWHRPAIEYKLSLIVKDD